MKAIAIGNAGNFPRFLRVVHFGPPTSWGGACERRCERLACKQRKHRTPVTDGPLIDSPIADRQRFRSILHRNREGNARAHWLRVKVARVLAHAEGADVPVESEHQDTQDQHLLKHNPNTHRNATASYNENHPKTDQDAKS